MSKGLTNLLQREGRMEPHKGYSKKRSFLASTYQEGGFLICDESNKELRKRGRLFPTTVLKGRIFRVEKKD